MKKGDPLVFFWCVSCVPHLISPEKARAEEDAAPPSGHPQEALPPVGPARSAGPTGGAARRARRQDLAATTVPRWPVADLAAYTSQRRSFSPRPSRVTLLGEQIPAEITVEMPSILRRF